jgi:Ran GTPase-activating protein (RanGAP) involved in mRNA processing and transport
MHATVRALRLPDAARKRDWWLRYTGLPSLKKWAFALEALHRRAASATLTNIALHCNSQCSALVPFFEVHAHLHQTLQNFSIASNGNLGPLGAAVVARALASCTAITDLDLTRNDVGVEGLRSLTPVLTTFRNLTRLALARNALGDSGVETVARACASARRSTRSTSAGTRCRRAASSSSPTTS